MLIGCKKASPDSIEAYVPFVFTGSVDPRSILTVGDQIVSEHVFAFHARESIKEGFQPVISRIDFSPDSGRIDVSPLHELKTSDGTPFGLKDMCRGVAESLGGTRHAPYAALVKAVDCLERERKVSVRLSAIPVNMRFLFTVPDFSIFDPAAIPLTPGRLAATTGPYSITAMTRETVELRRNPHYPASLVANTVPTVRLHSYPAAGTAALIDAMRPQSHHMVYLYGYAVSAGDLEKIKSGGYVVEAYPGEWLISVGFGKKVSPAVREAVAAVVDRDRNRWLADAPFGSEAYSVSPSDRPFGLSKDDYGAIPASVAGRDVRPLPTGQLVTHRSWHELPLFKKVCEALRKEFPGMSLRLVDDFTQLYSGENDVFISPLGISHSDPLSHMAFLAQAIPGFDSAISRDDVAEASVLADSGRFNAAVRGFERRIRERRMLVPIGHFPGIVAHAASFERDENIAFSWGIQAWSYRIR